MPINMGPLVDALQEELSRRPSLAAWQQAAALAGAAQASRPEADQPD